MSNGVRVTNSVPLVFIARVMFAATTLQFRLRVMRLLFLSRSDKTLALRARLERAVLEELIDEVDGLGTPGGRRDPVGRCVGASSVNDGSAQN